VAQEQNEKIESKRKHLLLQVDLSMLDSLKKCQKINKEKKRCSRVKFMVMLQMTIWVDDNKKAKRFFKKNI